jgi:hypothetical protein
MLITIQPCAMGKVESACILMSDKSVGLPTQAPIAPTVRPMKAFWISGKDFPSFFSITLFVRTLKIHPTYSINLDLKYQKERKREMGRLGPGLDNFRQ